ncbi:unnamed protein product [Somion occarium]|uniref:Regulatory protein ral2 n=1 Tax=Somion occarium TaxID=3059160 RepID=A0ABP1E1P0_9APHY
MYPIADLTAFCRRTTGDVPPKLVGASTTVVGSKLYLYGGRLVAERRMVSDIYMFDLDSFKWEKLQQSPDDDIPQARYFHSADTWNNHLIIFGGMAIQPQSDNPEDLCVLNDVRLFDLASRRWLPAFSTSGESSTSLIPKARYAHLSSVTANRLFVIGGQDLNNVWLDDIHVYDLVTKRWVQRRDYPRHCGTYRSVAVTADKRVRFPEEEGRTSQSKLGAPGTRFRTDKNEPPAADVTSRDSLIHLPYSAPPTEEYPCDIYLFSNYNFTDVQRELEVFSPLPDADFSISDRSSAMTGTSFPPGLRFPTGAILGTNFIIAGTYLSQSFQSFSVWTLDLKSMAWSRIDPGSALSGSWFRSCLWPEANKFLIFGNRHGNLVEDYNRRLLSWDHVAVIDLEAFGIYQPPPLLLDIPMQEMGLAALEEGVLADFEIICDDGRKVLCSRKVLEDRWPWFKEQRKVFIQAATRALETIPSPNSNGGPLPELPTVANPQEPLPDPRLTPRSFQLSEPYPITLAFVQYLYSMALLTPLQHAPAVLSQLLLLSSTYNLPHLQSLVTHAMHRALTFATSVGIYGVSTLCNCRSLQIRALRVVMAYSQKRPAGGKSRGDKDGDGSGGNGRSSNGPPGDGPRGPRPTPGSGSGSDPKPPAAARPRGLSDASYMTGPSDASTKMSDETVSTQLSQLSINTSGQSSQTSINGSSGSSGKSIKSKSPKSPKIRTANANDRPVPSPTFFSDFAASHKVPKSILKKTSGERASAPPTPTGISSTCTFEDMSTYRRRTISARDIDPSANITYLKEGFPSRSPQAASNEAESSLSFLRSPPPAVVGRRPSTAPTQPSLPSVPLFLHRKLSTRRERPDSVLSLTTEQELRSFAEILSANIQDDGSVAEQHESFGVPLEDDEVVIDDILSFHDVLQRVRPQRFSVGSTTTAASSIYPASRYTSSSASDYDHSDGLDTYVPPIQTSFPANTPRGRFSGSDYDTPSLRSCVSGSSMSSPSPSLSLSRPPSFQMYHLPTSPLSNTSISSLMTPVDPISGGMHGLGIIEERRNSEEFDPGFRVAQHSPDGKKSQAAVSFEPVLFEEEAMEEAPGQGWTYDDPTVWGDHENELPDLSEVKSIAEVSVNQLRSGSPETITGRPRASFLTSESTPTLGQPSFYNSTASLVSKSEGGGNAFTRLFKGGKRQSGRSVSAPQTLESITSPSSSSSDVSLSKSDAKRMKKEFAKARRERLAIDLKERAERREAEAKEAKKRQRAQRGPTEPDGMWGGLQVNTVL